jgi:hypothetical protein
MKHNIKSIAHRFLLQCSICNSKASLTSENNIPKEAATIKYLNFETQNYLFGGDQAPWAAGSSLPLLSYAYNVIHKLKGCR